MLNHETHEMLEIDKVRYEKTFSLRNRFRVFRAFRGYILECLWNVRRL